MENIYKEKNQSKAMQVDQRRNRRIQLSSWLLSAGICAFILGYMAYWHQSNLKVLYDPMVQTDDVRIQLFGFHMYGGNPAFANYKLAQEFLNSLPFFYKQLYGFVLQWTDLFRATKVLQWLCLALIFVAGTAFLRDKNHTRFTVFAFFIFFIFHTSYVTRIIVSALPRTFAIPSLALWVAGMSTHRLLYRAAGMAIGLMFYPPMGVILLGTEGVLCLRDLGPSLDWRAFLERIKKYSLFVLLGLLLLSPTFLLQGKSGRMHTYEEALSNPALRRGGRNIRSEQVPFNNVQHLEIFKQRTLLPLRASGKSLVPQLTSWINAHQYAFAYLFFTVSLLLVFFRRIPIPIGFLSATTATIILYFLARWFAFHLYAPTRFPQYGMWLATTVLTLELISNFAKKIRSEKHALQFSSGVLGLMFVMLVFTGSGMFKGNLGVSFSYSKRQKMYDFIQTLPQDSHILQHPMDENSISFWTARATTITYELLVPWYVEAWDRNKKRAQDALDALYSTSKEQFLEYAEKNKISHVLVHRGRFRKDFVKKSRVFSPLSQWIRKRLRKRKLEHLIFYKPPKEAVVYKNRKYMIFDVEKLKETWKNQKSIKTVELQD